MSSGAGGKRAVDAAAPDIVGVRDASVDISYPIVPGCVSGLPPSPQLVPTPIPPIAVGCAASTSAFASIFDLAGQGMVYNATLSPPVDGLSLSTRGIVCGNSMTTPVYLTTRQSALHPGASYTTTVSITPAGPPPQTSAAFGLTINVVPIDFSIDPVVLDFGLVTVGQFRRLQLTVTNATTSAPFDTLYPLPQQQGPFLLLNLPVTTGQSLKPGESFAMLEASINAVVMRAQISGANPPVP